MSSWVWVHSSVKFNKFDKKKCCANGALSFVSHNFDEELKMRFGMDEMPLFMILATMRRKFCQDCTKYNNLFAMAATKVCNYCDNSGLQIEVRAIIV